MDTVDSIVRAHRAFRNALALVLYIAPSVWFCYILWHEHHPALTIATVLSMPLCLVAAKLPKAWFRPRDWETAGTLYQRLGVPAFGRFVFNGGWMNERIRRVQPGHRRFLNAAARRTLRAATEAAEAGHWLWLLASVPPLVFGVIVRRYAFVATLLTGTVVMNVYPIALQRSLRARLETLAHTAGE